jgi:hypothetical protein
VLKTIPAKHFESGLLERIGTPYKKGSYDCSALIKTVMRDLGIIDRTFDGSSIDIMRKFTINTRKISEIRSGDFFYCKSARFPG